MLALVELINYSSFIGGALGAAKLEKNMRNTTVGKDSFAHKEFMAKVKELGGWIENDKVRFRTPYAAKKFEDWLADCNA